MSPVISSTTSSMVTRPFGAAELVDDDAQVDALRPHAGEQVRHAHRFGHVERLAHQGS
jgi:hypothetical protein